MNMKKSDIIKNVELAMNRDEGAIEALYKDTYARAYSLAFGLCHDREQTEDILQESYIAAFENLHHLDNKGNFWHWFRGIVLNKWRDSCKDKSLRYDTTLYNVAEDDFEEWQLESSAHDIVEQSITNDQLWTLVNNLPENQRVCMILFYYEDMKIEKIAEMLHIPVGSVKSRLHYGREKLKREIEESGLHAGAALPPIAGSAAVSPEILASILAALAPASKSSAAAAAAGAAGAASGTLLAKLGVGLVSAAAVAGIAGVALNMKKPAHPPTATATTTTVSVTTTAATTTTTTTIPTTTTTTPAPTTTTTAAYVSFDYVQNETGVTIAAYTGTAAYVSIPSEIGGKPVTAIGERAFQYSRAVRSVTIPDSVTVIGANAFRECPHLKTLLLGSGVATIEDMAFCGCHSLTAADIPGSVKSIGIYAFAYCDALQSVTLHEGTESIGYGAFYGCGLLAPVDLPSTVTDVGQDAF